MKNIKYIIRKRALGDVLWIEPIVREMAKKYKRIVVHTKFNALFENFPYKNVQFKHQLSFWEKCIVVIEKKLRISVLTLNLDNAYEERPYLHFLNAYQKRASLPLTQEYPKLYFSSIEEETVLVKGKYAVLHLESFAPKPFRQISGVNWNEIIRYLCKQDIKVVQIGTKIIPFENTINFQTSIRDLICLINHCELFIGLDSGPSHIASSLGKPSMIFFGAVNPDTRHFRSLFKGLLIKQPCEYDNYYEKVIGPENLPCTKSNDSTIAACCNYSTDYVLLQLNELMKGE